MQYFLFGAAIAAALLAIVPGSSARADVQIEQTSYQGWPGAYRMSNGTVELVLVPSIARVMHYGFVGGENVIWGNPATAGKPVEIGKWPNHGGDKVWPWPQSEWGIRTGSGWPPPPATDQVPHQASIVGPGRLRLTSPPLIGYGVRIVRDIEMAPVGSRVTVRSQLVKMRDDAAFPVGAWTITQMPVPDLMLARMLPESKAPEGWKLLGVEPWKAINRVGPDILRVERPTDTNAKIGMDADVLAWVKGDLLYSQRLVPPAAGTGEYQPAERAQIFTTHTGNAIIPSDVAPYVELEMTSPTRTLQKGQEQALEIVWELRRLGSDERSPDAVASLLRKM